MRDTRRQNNLRQRQVFVQADYLGGNTVHDVPCDTSVMQTISRRFYLLESCFYLERNSSLGRVLGKGQCDWVSLKPYSGMEGTQPHRILQHVDEFMDEFFLCWTDSLAFFRSKIMQSIFKDIRLCSALHKEHQSAIHPKPFLCQNWMILSCQVTLQSWHFWGSAGHLLVQCREHLQLTSPSTCGCDAQRACAQPTGTWKELLICSCHVLLARWWHVAAHWCVRACLKVGCASVLQCASLTLLRARQGHGSRDWAGMLHLTSSSGCLTWGCCEDLLLFFTWVKTTAFLLPLLQTNLPLLCRSARS